MVSHRTPGHYAAAATHVNQDCYNNPAHLFTNGPVQGTRHRPVTLRPYTTRTAQTRCDPAGTLANRHLLTHSMVRVN